MSNTYNHLLQLKIQSDLLDADIECRYIRTHTEENTSNICNITLAIWPFSHKILWIAILSTLESSSLDYTIVCASK